MAAEPRKETKGAKADPMAARDAMAMQLMTLAGIAALVLSIVLTLGLFASYFG